ncbi:LAFA_0F16050g1_1 [Lachancea sp. 'fantastica']|nr:LAFA_0F16050g1_1 [Lachancea sp. 'fantastica']
MGKKKATKSFRNSKQDSNESQSMDPLFGQSRAFALEGHLVNPQVRKYLKSVRQQALSTLGADPGSKVQRATRPKENQGFYDDEPVVNQKLARFDKNSKAWVAWFRELKNGIQETEGSSAQQYTPETLDLLLLYFKRFLQEAVEKGSIESNESVTKVLALLQSHNVEEDAETESLEIDEEWANSLVAQLKTKRFHNIQTIDELKRLISTPKPLPQNFNSWHNFITRTEPSPALLQRISDNDCVLRLASYLIQWVGDIPKNKNVGRISQWTLFVLLYLDSNLPAPNVSILRDLGKKARHCKLKTLASTDTQSIYHLKVPEGFPVPSVEIEPLTAIDLALAVVALEYGQRDLIDWTDT